MSKQKYKNNIENIAAIETINKILDRRDNKLSEKSKIIGKLRNSESFSTN